MERKEKDDGERCFPSEDALLKHILDALFDGVYVVDRDRNIIFWNKGAENITGYTMDDVRGRCCANDILSHIDATGVQLCLNACPLVRSMETGENVIAKVYPLCKGGGRIPVETHISPIRDDSGAILGAVEIFRDISHFERFRVLQEKFNDLIKKYVSNATYEGVMQQAQEKSGNDPVRRELTVLFADVVEFTRFSETVDPGEVLGLLNDMFTVCQRVTQRHFGDIDKFMGDAALAVFIDANDAVAAAQEIQAALLETNQARTATGRFPIRVRIGVNSGPVVQGDVG
ncbi:MAG TPA: adenylate/guanylate cyclase domain-containing protein, partial [Candidatus Hydrogenedentes bacterium]|nr:adenylate/guanylate cyclase domain-containing protein [Candidatus Hydrogenedentota bacterium]